ncbi:MAG: hypothetical protein IJJ45_03825 [Clostridia bacterium]|nr:hypothetical protein [Clostridia bacterium]
MGLEDYERCGNIKKYERVIIGRMTTLQLSGLALGLPVDGLCRAVTEALLNGVEVLMAADAPPHRTCAGQGSRALYAMLEGYVRQLMVFGVKPLEGCRDTVTTLEPPLPPEKQRPPQAVETHARPNRDRLVTEACAKRMCAGAEGEIRFGAGTLITPAARDVFAAAGITVVIE